MDPAATCRSLAAISAGHPRIVSRFARELRLAAPSAWRTARQCLGIALIFASCSQEAIILNQGDTDNGHAIARAVDVPAPNPRLPESFMPVVVLSERDCEGYAWFVRLAQARFRRAGMRQPVVRLTMAPWNLWKNTTSAEVRLREYGVHVERRWHLRSSGRAEFDGVSAPTLQLEDENGTVVAAFRIGATAREMYGMLSAVAEYDRWAGR